MNKREREISSIIDDCDIIAIAKRKIRKIMPIATDEVVDLLSDESNHSQTSTEYATEVVVIDEDKENICTNNGVIKLEKEKCPLNGLKVEYDEVVDIDNNALITELCSTFSDDDDVQQNDKALLDSINASCVPSKDNLISQDSAVVTANSLTNSCEIHFSEGIDELLNDDTDTDENNGDLIEDDRIRKNSPLKNENKNSSSLNLTGIKNLSPKKQGINVPATSASSSCETHFSEGIDDLLFDSDNENDGYDSNINERYSRSSKEAISNQQINKAPSNLSSIESQNSIITIDSGLTISDLQFIENVDDWDDEEETKNDLDLSEYRRCKIIEVDRKLRYMELTVCDPELPNRGVVLCTENWRDMPLEPGEFVIIKAKYSDFDNKWVINNEYGMCVTQPDTLVSGTAVVQGLFCNRKGVLQHIYTGIDCLPNIEANNAALTCGSITHELLQSALQEKIYSINDIWKILDRILKLPSTIFLLYTSDLTVKQIKEMISEYIPKIYEFISRYIQGNEPDVWDDNFVGKIETVRDIEESVWLPTLGLKGKIDATVDVRIHERRRIMPLEIKTGRSSFSPEHKGQVYLYIMMMQMLGYDLSSGLLLYIKENIMHEINSSRNDERDLILLRNMMAYYLSRESIIVDKSNDSAPIAWTKWQLPELPEPINHHSACKRCPYNTICCVYAKDDKNLVLPDNHPHSKLQKTILRHLTPDHIDYVVNWISLIQMESSFQKRDETGYSIWSQAPTKREAQRTCLSYMTIDLTVIEKNNMYLHKFIRHPKEKLKHILAIDDFRKVFDSGDYVMISTDIRMNIASGNVMTITKDSISVLLEKDITKWDSISYCHIDEFPSSLLPYRALGTIAAMLADNDITRRLRRIIIDREPATFTNKLPDSMMNGVGEQIMNQLNYYQKEALKAVISSTHFVLIKGMPGTGKTQTLIALIEMLSYLEYSVLITAHTHMAVDNILLKLNEKNLDFLRLGSKNRTHPSLRCKTDEYLVNNCESPEQLDARYNKKKIVAVTCLGSHHALLSKRIFDYCVVDECTQAMQPILLRPLYNATKFVLVGDPEQLPAVVKSTEARKCGMDEDLFTRLDNPNNSRILKQQYRMNKPIMDLANQLTYKGELIAANEQIANATLRWTHPEALESCEKWVKKTLSCLLRNSVIMLNTRTTHNMHLTMYTPNKMLNGDNQSSRCSNYVEVAIVLRLLNVLQQAGIKSEDIGVIAPYQAQLKLLKRVIKADVEINTVDQFQGRDKSVILLSCTRTGESDFKKRNEEYEILSDHKRLNVALTRAKHKLIIIGDKISLMRFKPFEKLFNILNREIIDLGDESNDFSWDSIVKLVNNDVEDLSP